MSYISISNPSNPRYNFAYAHDGNASFHINDIMMSGSSNSHLMSPSVYTEKKFHTLLPPLVDQENMDNNLKLILNKHSFDMNISKKNNPSYNTNSPVKCNNTSNAVRVSNSQIDEKFATNNNGQFEDTGYNKYKNLIYEQLNINYLSSPDSKSYSSIKKYENNVSTSIPSPKSTTLSLTSSRKNSTTATSSLSASSNYNYGNIISCKAYKEQLLPASPSTEPATENTNIDVERKKTTTKTEDIRIPSSFTSMETSTEGQLVDSNEASARKKRHYNKKRIVPEGIESSRTHILKADIVKRRKYICRVCSKGLTTSGHLARHYRIHTGEKNHFCPYEGCNQRFSRHDNCIQHYRTHLKKR
ncbi:hypothetical protein Kpol_1052p18 [Vanderwaltozyma polyspora DSM 70294]|uniref:C2H2-type domain-containing protein n=1 Tax=Vanderwaltozyma polyspora (strain ATCC 22028 / DSM 70294 / BCRC 21397 / CBS 2163 / NBRC 10782 / NRRL Y-8283 / UCD 57-17) TaxID=436907 RepID=A7TM29_VANPO|nr:uncharacterized protein Kpol_1052p18 [Vanderwaltozyma polyspora DSM 70294]EDO16671.1 hypothetical protein Kpol_1052p18 [Vanderwaltozyma polyspora DSM 70294]